MNTFFKNHGLEVGICTVALTAAIGIGVSGMTSQDQNDDQKVLLSLPTAGITTIFEEATNEAGQVEAETVVLSAGISEILNDYYASKQMTTSTANLKGVEKVLSMLSEKNIIEEVVLNHSAGEIVKEEATEPQAPQQPEEQPTEQQTEQPTEQPAEKPVTSVVPEYTVLGVANVTNYLNVREEPSLDGKILGKLPMNAGCEILGETNGWYQIHSGELDGYVSGEYLLTGEAANQRAKEAISTVAKVTADRLMVREEPNTNCTILTKVALDEELEVVEVLEGWVKVNVNSCTGYVCADYVSVYDTLPKGVTLKQLSYGAGVSNTAVDLIEYAKQFLGNPYVWGGTSLTNGADCSGFVQSIYRHFGYYLSRTSRTQAYDGTRIPVSEIRPGDLLFYKYGSSIGHVAIYIGNGQIIHASTPKTGIVIGNAYFSTPCCATRIIQ